MINITASGRLAHQPELKMGRQTNFCEFRLLSSRYARGEEHTEAVTFFCYGDEAERFCEHTEKGQLIEATGAQETQRWTDASGAEHKAVKYRLTWWHAGPRPVRSRQQGEQGSPAGGRDPRAAAQTRSAGGMKPLAPASADQRAPEREHRNGGEDGRNAVPLI